MLSALFMLPLVGVFALIFVDRTNTVFIRNFSLIWSLLVFNCSIFLLAGFDPLVSNFQFIESISWLPFANTDILFAVDGLSILLIILTTFLIPVCVLLCWKMPNQTLLKDYNMAFLLLESILIGIFCSLDLLVFYLLFEAVLIPMFFIVGIFGSRERKVRASYLLFLYTLVSSILLFVAILFIYFKTGTTNYLLLKTFEFDPIVERLCWLAFFFFLRSKNAFGALSYLTAWSSLRSSHGWLGNISGYPPEAWGLWFSSFFYWFVPGIL